MLTWHTNINSSVKQGEKRRNFVVPSRANGKQEKQCTVYSINDTWSFSFPGLINSSFDHLLNIYFFAIQTLRIRFFCALCYYIYVCWISISKQFSEHIKKKFYWPLSHYIQRATVVMISVWILLLHEKKKYRYYKNTVLAVTKEISIHIYNWKWRYRTLVDWLILRYDIQLGKERKKNIFLH